MQTTVGVPEEVKGLNWGGFLLCPIWSIFNQVWIGLASLVPCLGVVVQIYILIKGNELAWQARPWESVAQFHEVQRKWAMWGVIIVFGLAALYVVLALVMGFGLALVGATAGGGGGGY